MSSKDKIQAELSRFLSAGIVAVVATVNQERPNNSMIYYTTDNNNNFYFETLESTNKCQNLQSNPRTALVVANAEYLISVQVKGRAVELHGEEKKQIRKELVEKRHAFKVHKWPPHELLEFKNNGSLSKKTLFKIVPYKLYFFNLGDRSYPASLASTVHILIDKKDAD